MITVMQRRTTDFVRALSAILPPPSLRADEVSRHAVRMVEVARSGSAGPRSNAERCGESIDGKILPFAALSARLRAGDLVVVNDAATLPGSLRGRVHGREIELRLSAPVDGSTLVGVLMGEGDHRTRTEHRAAPPRVAVGDRLSFGAFDALVSHVDGRLIEAEASLSGDALWQALYTLGRPIQYAHRPELLPLWAVQTAYAARPWAAEMPSAGRPLTWDILLALRRAGVAIAHLTHAAGLSSTGDAALDRALPWPERYDIPAETAALIEETKRRGGRVIAIGTSVVRALEASGGRAGSGIATLRLDATVRPTVVDGLVSGLHVPGESHFDLLSAFVAPERLRAALMRASAAGLSAHELGDVCLVL